MTQFTGQSLALTDLCLSYWNETIYTCECKVQHTLGQQPSKGFLARVEKHRNSETKISKNPKNVSDSTNTYATKPKWRPTGYTKLSPWRIHFLRRVNLVKYVSWIIFLSLLGLSSNCLSSILHSFPLLLNNPSPSASFLVLNNDTRKKNDAKADWLPLLDF